MRVYVARCPVSTDPRSLRVPEKLAWIHAASAYGRLPAR